MKKWLIAAVLFGLIGGKAAAQSNKSQQLSTGIISTTKIKEEKEKKEKKGYMAPAVPGFQWSAEIAGTIAFWYNHIDIDYIAGYRLTPGLFVGGGVGVHIYPGYSSEDVYYINNYNYGYDEYCYIPRIAFPLYAHVRYYILKNRRWSPFVSGSIGGRLAPKQTAKAPKGGEIKYNTCGFLFNPAVGVNFRPTPKTNGYLSLGCDIQRYPYLGGHTDTTVTIDYPIMCGFSIHLGFTY